MFLRSATLLCLLLSIPSFAQSPFPSMDAEPGPVGGKAHWWRWDTMKGEDFWLDPPKMVDVRADEDGTYQILGEPPISVAIVLHPEWFPEEPWRNAIAWVREAENMFRQSGVHLRFIIESIEVWEDMPDTKESAFNAMERRKNGADMTIGLMPHRYGDRLCGIAEVGSDHFFGGSIKSVSGCDPITLAHEIGHNFGLRHDFNVAKDNEKGYCIRGESGSATTCEKGTIMSYSQTRVPFFSTPDFKYDDKPLGDENSDAVSWLNRVKTGRALAWELDQQRSPGFDQPDPEVAVCYE